MKTLLLQLLNAENAIGSTLALQNGVDVKTVSGMLGQI